jgi:hypothetical protein
MLSGVAILAEAWKNTLHPAVVLLTGFLSREVVPVGPLGTRRVHVVNNLDEVALIYTAVWASGIAAIHELLRV